MTVLWIEQLVAAALRLYRQFSSQPPSADSGGPKASQRSIAIAVAASETARQEGIRAAQTRATERSEAAQDTIVASTPSLRRVDRQ